MLKFKSLASGSTGNATLIQSGDGTGVTNVLVDCGLGIRQLVRQIEAAGERAEHISGIFITHEHGDHIGCARHFAVRYRTPVWMSRGTYAAIGSPDFDGLLQLASDDESMSIGSLQMTPFTVPHDAREPLQLTCTDGDTKLGILTDLGHATPHVISHLQGCHALLLETNHDEVLLAESAYPAFLKHRISGDYGHLSNLAAAEIARRVNHAGLKHVVAAHLSQQNNQPERVSALLAEALSCAFDDIVVASPTDGCIWLCL